MKRLVSYFKDTEEDLKVTTDEFLKNFADSGFKLMQAFNRFKNEKIYGFSKRCLRCGLPISVDVTLRGCFDEI